LPGERALAVAGDPDRVPWVTGMAGGYETRELAEAEAIRYCRVRRRARGLLAPCMLYAVGDDIVWPVR